MTFVSIFSHANLGFCLVFSPKRIEYLNSFGLYVQKYIIRNMAQQKKALAYAFAEYLSHELADANEDMKESLEGMAHGLLGHRNLFIATRNKQRIIQFSFSRDSMS